MHLTLQESLPPFVFNLFQTEKYFINSLIYLLTKYKLGISNKNQAKTKSYELKKSKTTLS